MSVSAPAIRVSRQVQQEIVQSLLTLGAAASERMGYVAAPPVAVAGQP
jgi:hypothetical protein